MLVTHLYLTSHYTSRDAYQLQPTRTGGGGGAPEVRVSGRSDGQRSAMPSVAALLLACSGYDVYLYAHVLYVQAQRA
jgi:hypothetical protein